MFDALVQIRQCTFVITSQKLEDTSRYKCQNVIFPQLKCIVKIFQCTIIVSCQAFDATPNPETHRMSLRLRLTLNPKNAWCCNNQPINPRLIHPI